MLRASPGQGGADRTRGSTYFFSQFHKPRKLRTTHTDDNFAIYFLQDETSLVAQFCRLGTDHSNEPFFSQTIIPEPEFKELFKDILGRVVLLEKANVVKKNLEGRTEALG